MTICCYNCGWEFDVDVDRETGNITPDHCPCCDSMLPIDELFKQHEDELAEERISIAAHKAEADEYYKQKE